MFLLSLGIIACKTSKIDNENKTEKNAHLQVNLKKQYALAEKINIKIKNISGNQLVLYNPTKKNFQKKTEQGWTNLRILHCPCDAPCKAPPERMNVANQKELELSWNQKESFCGKMTDVGIRETIYKKVEKGTYRFAITYKDGKENNTVYKEFKIN